MSEKRCAICQRAGKLLADHCHVTGVPRDWLCRRCNSGLGMFQDSAMRLTAAAAYISRHKANPRHPIEFVTTEIAAYHPRRDALRAREQLKALDNNNSINGLSEG